MSKKLTEDLSKTVQEHLPKMVADELLERISLTNTLEESVKGLEKTIKNLLKEIEKKDEKLEKVSQREDQIRIKKENLDKREEQVSKREVLKIRLEEAEKRERARMECFDMVFRNPVVKTRINGSTPAGVDQYNNSVEGYVNKNIEETIE